VGVVERSGAMTEIDTSAEAVEQRCELLRLQGMALATHFPRSPRFVGMFDGDIALLRALAAERAALAAELDQAVWCMGEANADRDRLAAERDALRAEVAAREQAAYQQGWGDREDDFIAGTERSGLIVMAPGELAAREAAAAEAMRTEIRSLLIAHAMHPALDKQTSEILMQLAGEALTLDLPAPDTLSRVRAEAMREGMERAAQVAHEAWQDGVPPAEIAAAIRAAAQEIKL